MKRLQILLGFPLFVLFTSCGQQQSTENISYAGRSYTLPAGIAQATQSDKDLVIQSFNLFYNEAIAKGMNCYNLSFKGLILTDIEAIIPNSSTVLGFCDGYKEYIVLDIGWLRALQQGKNEIILFHEIGHCFWNLNHYEDQKDIMNSSLGNEVFSMWNDNTSQTSLISTFFNRVETSYTNSKNTNCPANTQELTADPVFYSPDSLYN